MDATEEWMNVKKRKGKKNRKKGFSQEQIKLLETMFESETKPEPKKKVELAGELGLQPRQVAIWFQNRRARWKSKRIEQDYSVLRQNYDNLLTAYEVLNKEHHGLQMEVQRLTGILLGRRSNESSSSRICKDEEENLVGEDSSRQHDSIKQMLPDPRTFLKDMRFELLNIEEQEEEQDEDEDDADDDDDEDGTLTLEDRWCNLGPNRSTPADDYSLSSAPWWNSCM